MIKLGFKVLLCATAICLSAPLIAYAGDAASKPQTPVVRPVDGKTEGGEISDDDFVQGAADAIKQIGEVTRKEGTAKVTIVLTAILILSQLLIQATKTRLFGSVFTRVHHAGKLAIVSALTILTTLIPLLLEGVSFTAALVSGGVLSSIMVAGHQIYKVWEEKKNVSTSTVG